MAKVKNKNTNIEMIIRKYLWKVGVKYRLNYKIFGKPNIVIPKYKIVIFCDGNFWHGKNFLKEKKTIKNFGKLKY